MSAAKNLSSLKLKDLVPHVREYAKEHLTYGKLKERSIKGVDEYKKKYIDTGSPVPVFQLIGYGFLFAYAVAWPQEYRHYKHEQEAKLHGGEGHH